MDKKTYKKYINKLLKITGIQYLLNIPEKVSDEYLDSYKTDDKNNLFILLFNNTQKIKIHIWSHILAILGWSFVPYVIPKYFGFIADRDQTDILITISLYIFLIFYIEAIFFPDFRIKWKFIYENKIYNFIWNIGIILFISFFFKITGLKL